MRRCEPKGITSSFRASALVNIPKWKVVNAEGGTKYGSAQEPSVRTLHSRTSQFPTAIPFPTLKVHCPLLELLVCGEVKLTRIVPLAQVAQEAAGIRSLYYFP